MRPDSARSILIVQTAYLGDVILATPLIRVARSLWPEAAIDFLCIPQTEPLLQGHPLLRRTIPYDKRGSAKGLRGSWRVVQELRSARYDLALVPHRSLRSALVVCLAGIPTRVGFDRSTGRRLLTATVPYRRGVHEVERNLDLLRPFGRVTPSSPELFPSDQDRSVVDKALCEVGHSAFVALAPGSVWATKRWPAQYFAELAARIQRQIGLSVILVGGPNDRSLCQEIAETNPSALNLAGHLTPLQSAEVIRRAQLLVTNDTAPLHMASAMGTPTVAIFGPTVPAFGFGPYRIPHRIAELDLPCRPCSEHGGRSCPIGTHECMLELKPAAVFRQVEELLEESRES